MEFGSLVRRLMVNMNDELEKEMNAYAEVDWVEFAIKAMRLDSRRRKMQILPYNNR
jgi:hypothetical protein